MAKRKAGVNNIIYELDNEDLTASSDDELNESKIKILKPNIITQNCESTPYSSENVTENSNTQLPVDKVNKNMINIESHNGGKNHTDSGRSNASKKETNAFIGSLNGSIVNVNKNQTDICKSILFNELVDSPASSSDLGVVGCVNKTPLVSVRFRDNKLAKLYKREVKKFMLDLIKLHENDNFAVDSDTDIELDIWPEDFEDEVETQILSPAFDDNLFFVDTDPCPMNVDIPMYEQAPQLISNAPVTENSAPPVVRQRFTCFNCDGDHQLKDCTKPRNHAKIAERRRNLGVKLGRYHVEDDQKYGHLIPGRISGQLRHALGLKRYELPLHIYRMRLLGYPCGWMEEAKIMPSGITMFDSTGTAILDPDEEEGEVCEPGSKDMYDIKKILDFPGFNVPASSKYKEESYLYGLPPMSDHDSKILMLQRLAPNAMKAYKRKKLTFFPSSVNKSQEGQAEMELDSGDEIPEFPFVPPLPDEEPPKLPSPPPPPPETPPKPKPPSDPSKAPSDPTKPPSDPPKAPSDPTKPPSDPPKPPSDPPKPPSDPSKTPSDSPKPNSEAPKSQSIIDITKDSEVDLDNKSLDNLEINVPDIPVPEDDLITIDDDDEISLLSSGRDSPTIDDLVAKKQQLLDAIKSSEVASDSGTDTELSKVIILSEDKSEDTADESFITIDEFIVIESDKEIENNESEKVGDAVVIEDLTPSTSEPIIEDITKSDSEVNTPDMKTGKVKKTLFGTPVMNIVSPFVKLPSDDKFSKDICDVINFENLPNSIGKYKKISSLLKKVKGEVDRIQES